MTDMKILKYALLALAVLVVLAGGLVAYVAATFDPNDYKPQLVQAVKERTQRTLKLEGDIALSFWPSIGAKIGSASLSERGSDREFARVAEAHVSLKLLPLLSKQVVADTVRIKGLRANVVRSKDGSTNMDDLTGASAPKEKPAPKEPAFPIDVAGVVIEDATVTYTDQAAGTRYVLSNLDLETGRIAPGVPAKIDLSLRAQSDKPRLSLDVKAAGSVMANFESGEFAAEKLNVSVSGKSGKDTLDVKVEAPKLRLAADKASGDKVSVVATISGPDGTTKATLALPGIEGTSQAFRSAAARLELEVKRADLDLKARMASPLTGNAKAQQVSLPQLKASISASGPNLPGKSIAGELAGSASVDGAKQAARADLGGKIGDSNIKAQFSVADFTPLALSFNLDVDQLDVDRYLPAARTDASGKGKEKGKGAGKQPEKPFDLTALRNLKANGKMHFGSLKANNVKASNVRVDVRAGGGRVDLSPLTASLYQGTLSSAITVNAAPAVPTFAVKHAMSGINIGPFLQDLADNDTLEGKANLTLSATTQGNTVTAMKKALNGKAGMKVTDGAIKGIDIPGTVRGIRSQLGALRGEKTQQADKRQKTDFSELSATFNIRNGVAHNNDLALKSPLLRGAGEGEINIGEDTINYLLKASIVGSLQGQGGRGVEQLKDVTVPVRVTGALDSPSYRIDLGAVATGAAKERVAEEIQKRLGGGASTGGGAAKQGQKDRKEAGSGSGTRDVLRGILGR
jgi:AsmA protein